MLLFFKMFVTQRIFQLDSNDNGLEINYYLRKYNKHISIKLRNSRSNSEKRTLKVLSKVVKCWNWRKQNFFTIFQMTSLISQYIISMKLKMKWKIIIYLTRVAENDETAHTYFIVMQFKMISLHLLIFVLSFTIQVKIL